jgi:glyoxylase-like metal-dependent hydrolase (beta-lactamase superfamily II)
VVIHRLNTGWIESMPGVSLLNAGYHPAVPGGVLRPYGFGEVRRPDGTVAPGTMIPAPAWYIEGAGPKILVDTGTGRAEDVIAVQELYGGALATITEPEHDIVTQLEALGVGADEIDIVVHTHLHFDHVGANERFPNARFLIHQAELPWALCPPPFGVYYYREFGEHVLAVLDRIDLVFGDRQVAPGVRMVFTGGHSPGHCVVFVDTDVGRVVIAGDAVYNYRNLEYEWPQGPLFDVGATLQAIQTLKSADVILCNHDPFFDVLFPSGRIGDGALPEATADYMRRLCTAGAFPLEAYVEA